MSEEELYKLALSDVPTYSLLNEILAIRDKRFSNEEVDYCVNVNGYISLDALNKYVKIQQENQQLLETSKAYKKLLKTTMQKEHQAIKVLDEIRAYIKDTCYYPELENYSNMTSDEVIELMDILDKVIK